MMGEAHIGMEKDRSGQENLNHKSAADGGGQTLMTKKYLPLSGRKQGTLTVSKCLFSTIGLNHWIMKLSCALKS
jgi:hypothetical protein